MSLMGDGYQESKISLQDFLHSESLPKIGKGSLSDPNVKIEVSVQENNHDFAKKGNYDEIDYIEDLLSEETKDEMQFQGIELRCRSRTESREASQCEDSVNTPWSQKGDIHNGESRHSLEIANEESSCFYNEILRPCSSCVEYDVIDTESPALSQKISVEVLSGKQDGIESQDVEESESGVCDANDLPADHAYDNIDRGKMSPFLLCLGETSNLGTNISKHLSRDASNPVLHATEHQQEKKKDSDMDEGSCSTKRFVLDPLKPKNPEFETLDGKKVVPNESDFGKLQDGTLFSAHKLESLRKKNIVRCPVLRYRIDPLADELVKECLDHERSGDSVLTKSESNEKEAVQQKGEVQNEIIEEIEKRLTTEKFPDESKDKKGGKVRRFYFGSSGSLANIETCLRINDLRYSTLYGKMYMKEGKGRYKSHWFQLNGPNLSCFGNKKHPISQFHVPNEVAGDIIHPEENDYFLIRKLALNIFESRVYLVKNKATCLGAFKCSLFFQDEFPELLDITESKIVNVGKSGKYYVIDISSENLTTVSIPALEFALENAGAYVFFKVADPDVFIRWLIALSFRQGREVCDMDQ